MSRFIQRIAARLAGQPAPPPPPVPIGPGWPRTFRGDTSSRFFDPALQHYPMGFRAGDPAFGDPDIGMAWAQLRRQATDRVLRAIAESAWGDRLVLRGSRLLRAWLGGVAREPGDLDWIAEPANMRHNGNEAQRMFDDIIAAVFAQPAPIGIAFDRANVATDDIWTYERAPGRRVVFPWSAVGLPGGTVQVDIVFGEELSDPAKRTSILAADGGCVSVRAATPAQSLAWKLLWLLTDMHAQGKDLYDAVILAEQFPLPFAVFRDTLRRGDGGPPPTTSVGLTRDWNVDWANFQIEFPVVDEDAGVWQQRLETALRSTFGEGPAPEPDDPTVTPSWLTSTVVALARGIDDESAFDRLPILADALQDAGCDAPGLLNHCREPGPHARGCWVVDEILAAAREHSA